MESLERVYSELIVASGDNPNREGLKDTPKRAAAAFKYMTRGYHQDVAQIINGALFTSAATDMVLVKDIELYSLCEHHLLPFIGKCHVGYLPDGKVIGLSKIARVVDVFAQRLQIQEELTRQIAECIQHHTNARGVAVIIEAKHLCMMMRGVEKQHSFMKTSCMLGAFRDCQLAREELLHLLKMRD